MPALRFLAALAVLLSGPHAVGQGALSFMHIPNVHAHTALGDAGVGLPLEAAQAFLSNPAHTAAAASTSYSALGGFGETGWGTFLRAADPFALSGSGFSVGLAPDVTGVPVRLGLGLARSRLDFPVSELRDQNNEVIDEVNQSEQYWAAGLSVGVAMPIALSAGVNVRRFTQRIPSGSPVREIEVQATSFDLGLVAEAPLASLTGLRTSGAPVGVVLDVALGYALMGIGNGVRGTEDGPVQPLERRVRLGWSLRAGYDFDAGGGAFRVAEVTVAFEADRSLLRFEAEGTDYLPPFVSPFGALTGTGRDTIFPSEAGGSFDQGHTGRRGLGLTLVETLSYSWGRFEGENFVECSRSDPICTTSGFALSLGGGLRVLGSLADKPALHRLGTRFDLRYVYSDHPYSEPFHTATVIARLP